MNISFRGMTRRQRMIGMAGCIIALICDPAAGQRAMSGESGLAVPRFVSVKADRAHVRYGPGTGYPIKWTFTRRGVPVEILQEFDNWRRIRDWEGQEGWIFHALLASRRTGFVSPWKKAQGARLRSEPDRRSATIAILSSRVLVNIEGCDGRWCAVETRSIEGYVRQSRLWGAYPGEVVR